MNENNIKSYKFLFDVAEPGNVKFEVSNQKLLESEGTRCSSAGRIERKLQLFKKKEATEEQRRNSTDGIFFKPQTGFFVI